MKLKHRPIPIKLEVDPTNCLTTAYAGIMPYLDLWNALQMPITIDSALSICGEQGWIDRQMIQSLVLLNLIGGDCVTDIEKLEADLGLCQMVRAGEYSGACLFDQRNATQAISGWTEPDRFLQRLKSIATLRLAIMSRKRLSALSERHLSRRPTFT